MRHPSNDELMIYAACLLVVFIVVTVVYALVDIWRSDAGE